jgi:glycerol-1-phosphate dehydrogenase [NAD(P)+]
MLAPPTRPNVFHGEQVGVTTLSMARLQEILLASQPMVSPDTVTEYDVIAHFGPELGRSVWPEFAAKLFDKARADQLNHRITTQWNVISARLSKTFLSPSRIESVLHAAGAPVTPQAIHLERSFYDAALLHGREIRNRYTVLDVMAASGRLANLLPTL